MVLGRMPTRPALLVSATDDCGNTGFGEIWANFPPRATVHKAHLFEDVIAPHLGGMSYVQPAEVIGALRGRLGTYFLHVGQLQVFEHLLAGLDCCLWDLKLRALGRSVQDHFGLRGAEVQAYASSINYDGAEQTIADAAARGFTHFKIKLGFDDARDRALLRLAARALPPGARLLVDANQAWSVDTAIRMLNDCADIGLGFVEEPIRADAPPEEWRRLVEEQPVPVAVGENVYGPDGFRTMIDAGVSVVQPDVAKWGGLSGALDVAAILPDGVKLWPHFMGSEVGQAASLVVSAVVGDSMCEMDINPNPLRTALLGAVPERGLGPLYDGPGLGPVPGHIALDRFADPFAGGTGDAPRATG